MRAGVILLLAALLAGCATAVENTLSPERRAGLKIESVKVTFAPDASLRWAEAESEFDRTKDPNGGAAAYMRAELPSGERRAFIERKAAARITEAFQKQFAPSFRGTEPARVEVVVKTLDLPSGLRRVTLGGNHMIAADITVVNAKSGQVILRASDFRTQAVAGNGIGGVLLDQVIMSDPIDRAADVLAKNYRSWLGDGSQMQGSLL